MTAPGTRPCKSKISIKGGKGEVRCGGGGGGLSLYIIKRYNNWEYTRKALSLDRFMNIAFSFLPLHDFPLPEYPGLQVHR